MIAVEIPAALAEHPEVVPVDRPPMSPPCARHAQAGHVESCACPADLSALVGQRVALAWRETCSTCKGRGCPPQWKHGHAPLPPTCCPDCDRGSRMVVGWTAEVAEVLPIVDGDNVPEHLRLGVFVGVANGEVHLFRLDNGSVGIRKLNVGPADWSPGRYALVLRDVWPFDPGPNHTLNLTPCRPFSGFAELDEVL